MIERIIIDAEGKTERVRVRIEWAGGTTTESIMIRPVAKLKHLSYYPKLCERVRSLAAQGMTAAAIARCLNEEGYRPPKRREGFDRQSAQDLIHRLGLSRRRLRSEGQEDLGRQEWWLGDLSCELGMPQATLYGWLRGGRLKACQQQKVPYRWIVWADCPGWPEARCSRIFVNSSLTLPPILIRESLRVSNCIRREPPSMSFLLKASISQ